jgi:hypothetical protein
LGEHPNHSCASTILLFIAIESNYTFKHADLKQPVERIALHLDLHMSDAASDENKKSVVRVNLEDDVLQSFLLDTDLVLGSHVELQRRHRVVHLPALLAQALRYINITRKRFDS